MATITIHTQYYENYSDTKTPYWKPKGGQVFEIENVNGDTLMYCDNLKDHLTNLVAAQSNEHVKFELLIKSFIKVSSVIPYKPVP